MALLNHAKKELSAKIVYYGPGLSGKTTNLEWIHRKWEPDKRGKLISLETKTDRTLFFDFLPVQIGEIAGYRTRFNVYTVPGQIFYNETRKMVLKGVDGVVFVVDSQKEMASENVENLKNLAENLRSIGKDLRKVPMVLQYNKRDLPNTLTVEELNRLLNQDEVPFFEAIAVHGEGVLTTLTRVTRMVADDLRKSLFTEREPAATEIPRKPSPTSNVHPFPLRPPAGTPDGGPQNEGVPAFLSSRPQSTPSPSASAASVVSDLGIASRSEPTLLDDASKPHPSYPSSVPNLLSQNLEDLGEPDAQTLNEPLADHLPSFSAHPEEEPPLEDSDETGFDDSSTSVGTPGSLHPRKPGALPSTSFQSLGLGLSLAEVAQEEASELQRGNELDPSLIVPADPSRPNRTRDAFSILLGNPARDAANEIRIPLSIRHEEGGETFSFQVSIRIHPEDQPE